MSKTIELRKDIQNIFKSITENVYFRKANRNSLYPHIVYSIEDIYNAKVLTIDIWDKYIDTSRIEEIADNLEKIKNIVVNSEFHSFILYYNNDRKWVDDEDKEIQRINLSFQINYYGKE